MRWNINRFFGLPQAFPPQAIEDELHWNAPVAMLFDRLLGFFVGAWTTYIKLTSANFKFLMLLAFKVTKTPRNPSNMAVAMHFSLLLGNTNWLNIFWDLIAQQHVKTQLMSKFERSTTKTLEVVSSSSKHSKTCQKTALFSRSVADLSHFQFSKSLNFHILHNRV